jgi:hypothetical protein
MNIGVEFHNKSAAYPPGSEVAGSVLLTHPTEWKALHADVVLFWRTQGRGNRDEGVAAVANLVRFEQQMTPSFTGEFSFKLPTHPWSYFGKLLKIRWYVGVYVVGDNSIDAEVEIPILVHPQPERFEGWNAEG